MEKYSRDNLPEGVAADFCELRIMASGEPFSPKMAIGDFVNQFIGLNMRASLAAELRVSPMDLLRERQWKGCVKFSDKFPHDKFPEIIASQNQSDIKALDEIVDEINLWFAAGELTMERIRDFCSRAASIAKKYNFLS